MLKVCVLSNDPVSSAHLIQLVSKIEYFNFVSLSGDLSELIFSTDVHYKIDVVIVDRYVNDSNIVKLTEILSLIFKFIIYSKNKLATECENNDIAFIQPPYSSTQLKKIGHKFAILNTLKNTTEIEDHFFVKCEKGKIKRVNLDEILFIEADQNYMPFHQYKESYAVNLTLNGIEKALPANGFIRVHRSFIINVSKIHSIEASRILILGDKYIPIGQSYRKKILSFFSGKILEAGRIV